VTLGPVSLTEVIRDAKIDIHTAVTPQAAVYHQSELPQSISDRWPPGDDAGVVSPAVWRQRDAQPYLRLVGQRTRKMAAKVRIGDWEVEPYFKYKGTPGATDEEIGRDYNPGDAQQGTGQTAGQKQAPHKVEEEKTELGVKVQYVAGTALKAGADVRLTGEHVQIRSHMVIADGKMDDSNSFVIDGIDRLQIGLAGGAENGSGDNAKGRLELPLEFAEAIPPEMTGGVPFAVHMKVKLIFETAFSGKNSTLWTHGDYKLSGPIGFESGKTLMPTLEVEKPMMEMHGITIGASGMVVAVEFRWLVGLGTEIAMAGPYGKLTVAAGVSKGSFLGFGLANCRGTTLKGDLGIGIGVLVDSKWMEELKKATGRKWKKAEVEMFETSFTFFSCKWVAPKVPLCRSEERQQAEGGEGCPA
jgi:hypothetical protein